MLHIVKTLKIDIPILDMCADCDGNKATYNEKMIGCRGCHQLLCDKYQ